MPPVEYMYFILIVSFFYKNKWKETYKCYNTNDTFNWKELSTENFHFYIHFDKA